MGHIGQGMSEADQAITVNDIHSPDPNVSAVSTLYRLYMRPS